MDTAIAIVLLFSLPLGLIAAGIAAAFPKASRWFYLNERSQQWKRF